MADHNVNGKIDLNINQNQQQIADLQRTLRLHQLRLDALQGATNPPIDELIARIEQLEQEIVELKKPHPLSNTLWLILDLAIIVLVTILCLIGIACVFDFLGIRSEIYWLVTGFLVATALLLGFPILNKHILPGWIVTALVLLTIIVTHGWLI